MAENPFGYGETKALISKTHYMACERDGVFDPDIRSSIAWLISRTDYMACDNFTRNGVFDPDIESNIPWKELSAFIYLILDSYHLYRENEKGIYVWELLKSSLLSNGTLPDELFWTSIHWESSKDWRADMAQIQMLFSRIFPDKSGDDLDYCCDDCCDSNAFEDNDNRWKMNRFEEFKRLYHSSCEGEVILGRFGPIFLVAKRVPDGTEVHLFYSGKKLAEHEEMLIKGTVRFHLGMDRHWPRSKNDIVYEMDDVSKLLPCLNPSGKETCYCTLPRPRRRHIIARDMPFILTECEALVAEAIWDLVNSLLESRNCLEDLAFQRAFEINLSSLPGKPKAVVIRFPYRLRETFHKYHSCLVSEVEKRFNKQIELVVMIATRNKSLKTGVLKAMLEDIIYPAKIIGNFAVRSKIVQIYLDPEHGGTSRTKLEMFSELYEKLSGKRVKLILPSNSLKKATKKAIAC